MAALAIHLPTLSQPLLEVHPFRQTHTAWTALLYHEQGIDLLHPMVPVVGPPFLQPWEFPLFEALASLVMDAGVAPDTAMRATGLAMYLLTALLLWGLVSRLFGKAAGLLALLTFLLTPLGLLWSRTSMIEYLATAAGVGYVAFSLLWHERGWRWWYVAAIVAGSVAMLVKGTTGVLYVLPVAALGVERWQERHGAARLGPRYAAAIIVLLAAPLALGVAWTVYADFIKMQSPFTVDLVGLTSLRAWYFGSAEQELDFHQWADFLSRANGLLLGGAGWLWIPLAVIAAAVHPRRLLAFALLAGAVLGPLIFTNQYFVNDYYLAAISPIVAAGLGAGASWLWAQREGRLSRVVALSLAVAWVLTALGLRQYWLVQFRGVSDPEHALAAAHVIAAESRTDELVVVTGRLWYDPAALYYARRKGLVVPEDYLNEILGPQPLLRLRELGYGKLFDCPLGLPVGCDRVIDLAAEQGH